MPTKKHLLATATLLAALSITAHAAPPGWELRNGTWVPLVAPGSVPSMLPLLVPVLVYAGCLLAAATSLPLLRRAAHPAELRFT